VIEALRSAAWTAGTPARVALIGLIRVYRLVFSGWLGGQCRFYPSCSHYGEEAIRAHGAIRGTALTAWRIARCGPFTDGGVDPVPVPRHGKYDVVTHGKGTT
jgi:putative membrane protein insertion efficiency factor